MAKCSQRKIRRKNRNNLSREKREKNADQVEKKAFRQKPKPCGVISDHVGHYRTTNTCAILYYIACSSNATKSPLFCPCFFSSLSFQYYCYYFYWSALIAINFNCFNCVNLNEKREKNIGVNRIASRFETIQLQTFRLLVFIPLQNDSFSVWTHRSAGVFSRNAQKKKCINIST